jgi:hypothetical protein
MSIMSIRGHKSIEYTVKCPFCEHCYITIDKEHFFIMENVTVKCHMCNTTFLVEGFD